MKNLITFSLIICAAGSALMASSCGIKISADGSKAADINAEAAIRAIEAISDK